MKRKPRDPRYPDVLELLQDLHHQATVERSHYYSGNVIREAIREIENLRFMLREVPRKGKKNGN